MLRRICVCILILSIGLTGCSTNMNKNVCNSTPTPKFEVAADKQNDPVLGLTPEIQDALIQSYLADPKVGGTRENFIKVVNSLSVEGGTEFLVRVKDGFFVFFMDNQSKEISLLSGSIEPDVSHTAMSYSVSPIKSDSSEMIFVGFFNLANARKAEVTWSNGIKSPYELTNGTIMLSPYDREITVDRYEIKDESGKTLFSGEWP